VEDAVSKSYEDFLSSKHLRVEPAGIEPSELPSALFPHQRDLVRWALRKGRAAIFADTGLGKSLCEMAWARRVSEEGRVLILAPLAVAQQLVGEGRKFGIESTYARQDEGHPITVTNYEMLGHFDPAQFVGIVLDECFAAGTMVDTVSGPRPIESLRIGDEIKNAAGDDVVADVHRREVPFGVKVTIDGASCIASPNHPFLTQCGWVGAQDLRAGDYALETAATLRLVRLGILPEVPESKGATFLRAVLLSEMADATAGNRGEGPLAGGSGEARGQEVGVVQSQLPGGAETARADSSPKSDVSAGSEGEGVPPLESDEPSTFRTWRERPGNDRAAGDSPGGSGAGLGAGVELVVGPTDSWLSHALQTRHRPSRQENRDRGGWKLPLQSEASGRKEGRETGFARVDGAEVLEPGHPELERLRSPDGKLYFYDLGATRHPSFSVNGKLVHNSSLLKAFNGKTRNALIEAFAATPFRLAATATPAPNDFTELGNHSEFLGVRSRVEMLAEFFVHDGGSTQNWRLKGHAVRAFWEWVASWGAIVRSPADLGHDASAFELPPLRMHEHVVPVEHRDAWSEGFLFAPQAQGLAEARAIRRATTAKRVALAASLVADDAPAVIWCELNTESEALAKAIPDAVEVRGSNSVEEKVKFLEGFASGRHRVMVSKPSIAGFGLNWQHCARQVFLGASYSYEQTYQAIRRSWRFGQNWPVDIHIIRAEIEDHIIANYRRKEAAAERLAVEMTARVRDSVQAEVLGQVVPRWIDYQPRKRMEVPRWLKAA
jgi:hypothetical protein